MPVDPLIRPRSYLPIEKLLDELMNRLAAAGIKVQPSRLAAYRRSFRLVRERAASGYWENASIALKDEQLWNDVYEVYSLEHACSGFSDLSEPGLRARLEKAISGASNLADEKRTGTRDTLFELVMASWLRVGGFKVSLQNSEDVWFEIQGVPCIMECKRIQSISKLKSRIDKASEQLIRQLRAPQNTAMRGFVAVDISKVFMTSYGVLRGGDWKALGNAFSRRLREFAQENMKDLASPSHERIIVVYLFAGSIGLLPDGGFFSLFGGLVVALHENFGCNRRLSLRFRDAVNRPDPRLNV